MPCQLGGLHADHCRGELAVQDMGVHGCEKDRLPNASAERGAGPEAKVDADGGHRKGQRRDSPNRPSDIDKEASKCEPANRCLVFLANMPQPSRDRDARGTDGDQRERRKAPQRTRRGDE